MSCLDASMAFDRISHVILFKKLIARNVPLYIVRILWFWYRNQILFVKWNVFSEDFTVNNGVKQGSALSPLFYNLYVDELSIQLNSYKIGCCIKNGVIVNHLMYADDVALIAPSVKGLQTIFNVCHDYGTTPCIVFNKDKSLCMQFKSKQCKWWWTHSPISLGTYKLQFVDHFKYLGHSINDSLTDDVDIAKQLGAYYGRANMSLREFGAASDNVKIILFKSFCTQIYCGSLWCSFKRSSIKNVRVVYNNCFRLLLKLPKYCSASQMFMKRRRRVMTFDVTLRKCKNSLMYRFRNSCNEIIRAMYSSDMYYKSTLICHILESTHVCGI